MRKSFRSFLSVFILLSLLFVGLPPTPTVTASADTSNNANPPSASGDFALAKSMGGTEDDFGRSIAIDSSGNVYTTGFFAGIADFDPGAGTFNLSSPGGRDIFVTKLDSSGNFIWAKRMGGTSDDEGRGIAVDSSGNVYTTGMFIGTADFDPGAGTASLTSAGSRDIFVSKLDGNGDFVWAKRMGGTGDDAGFSIGVNSSGVHTTGGFIGTADFDPGAGTANLTSAGGEDIFVSKLNSSGNLIWARRMGGIGNDVGISIGLNSSLNVHTTGYFAGTADFDPGTGTVNLTSAGSFDIFVSKLDGSGNFLRAKRMGGTNSDEGAGIAIDARGNIYTTGSFGGNADFNPGVGTASLISSGSSDIFVTKFDGSGNFVWAKGMGGASWDEGNSIIVDSLGNVFTTGYFLETADFNPGTGTANLTSAGIGDIFVSKLDGNGNFVWAKRMGGTMDENGTDIALDLVGNVYTTGPFDGTANFNPGAGTFNLTSTGLSDIFVSKLENDGVAPTVSSIVRASANPTAVASVNFTVTFSESVTGVNTGAPFSAFALTTTGVTGAVITGVSGSGATRTVTVDTGTGSGTIRLDVPVSAVITDLAGNLLDDLPFNIGETYTVNKTLTFNSIGTQDGRILESSETSNQGGTLDNAATLLVIGDNAQDKQYRSFLSFNTSGLPDDAIITKAQLKIKVQGFVGNNMFTPVKTHGNLVMDIRVPFFGADVNLAVADFQSAASKGSVGVLASAPTIGTYTITLNGTAYPFVNQTGTTQFRLRFQTDDNDDLGADYLKIYSGDAGAANRPQLIVEYDVP